MGTRRFLQVAAIALVGLLFVVGPGFMPGTSKSQGSIEREITILMGDQFFQVQGAAPNIPINLEVAVPYLITFKNVGKAVHRVKFGRGVEIEEGEPFTYVEDLFEGVKATASGETATGRFSIDMERFSELQVDPGVELTIEFTLPQSKKGEWEIGCFFPGHYDAGMFAPLTVQ